MHLKAIQSALRELKRLHQLRLPDDSLDRVRMEERFGSDFIDAASNDYLGLSGRIWGGRSSVEPERESTGGDISAAKYSLKGVSSETGTAGSPRDDSRARENFAARTSGRAGRNASARSLGSLGSLGSTGSTGSAAGDSTVLKAESPASASKYSLDDVSRETGPAGSEDSEYSLDDVSRETEGDTSNHLVSQGGGLSSPTPSSSGAEASGDSEYSLDYVSRETGVVPGGKQAAPGAGSSRLIFGTHPEHLALESEVAAWLGFPAALFFPSGYSANVGALAALLSPEDAVFSDRLNHASLIDGIRLSRARAQVFSHLDLKELEEKLRCSSSAPARWVIVESYYSMDGDGPDLAELRTLCDRFDAHLYVDEAHSVGTFGPEGSGLCARAGMQADVLMVAFGKSVGSQGACILGSEELRIWLWNRARSFVFSTGPSPLLAQSLREQVSLTKKAEAERFDLERISVQVRRKLQDKGVPLQTGSFGPVLSVLLGEEQEALRVAEGLRADGILAQAVRPPTVPPGHSRVRLVLRASFSKAQVSRLCEAVARETKKSPTL